MEPTLHGRLLVATPGLHDPNFRRTVVLLLRHDADGALGVVLNRPSDTQVSEVLDAWAALATPPTSVHVGGPVQPNAAIALARVALPAPPDCVVPLYERIGTVDLEADPAALGGALERLRVFAGYAGWDAAQLAAEIDEGSWYLLDGSVEDVFTGAPDHLWHDVLRRQGGRIALGATCPTDPSMN